MKKLLVVVALVALASIGIVSAQEPGGGFGQGDGPRGGRGENSILRRVLALVADETGLTPQEIAAQEGKTLSEIITENGGSIENIQAEMDEAIDELLNTPLNELHPHRGFHGERGLFGRGENLPVGVMAMAQEIAQLADVDIQEVAQQLREGSTLNQIIAGYGLDAATVIANVEAEMEERLNQAVENGRLTEEQANERRENVNLTELLDASIPDLLRERAADGIVRRAVVEAIADALDKQPRDIRREIGEGQTLGDYITANNADLAAISADTLAKIQTFVDARVADGQLTQEDADVLIAGAEAKITETLSETFPKGGRRRHGGN